MNEPSDRDPLLAEDEDAAAGAEPAAEAAEAEEAARAAHVGVRHEDEAVRVRPARILAQGGDPVPLLRLLGVVE